MVGSLAEQREQAAALERLYTPVSPLARPSLLPSGHTLVIAGEADVITGIPHGRRLASHFDAVSRTYSGGHILPLGKDAAFAPLWELLQSCRPAVCESELERALSPRGVGWRGDFSSSACASMHSAYTT